MELIKSQDTAAFRFRSLLSRLSERYISNYDGAPASEGDLAQQKSDAEELRSCHLALLKEMDDKETAAMQRLVDAIDRHILDDGSALDKERAAAVRALGDEVLDEVEGLAVTATTAFSRQEYDTALETMKQWAARLAGYASEKGEHPSIKESDPLVIVGHSLGGSCGQAALHHCVTGQHRIPLPGKRIELHLFAVDEEGIASRRPLEA